MAVYLHNDHADTWADTLIVRRFHVDGRELAQLTQDFTVEPRETYKWELPADWTGPAGELIVAQTAALDTDQPASAQNFAHGGRGWYFFGRDFDIPYADPSFTTTLTRDGDTLRLTVTPEAVVRDLCLLADHLRPDAAVDDAPLHLLPGESHTFVIHPAPPYLPSPPHTPPSSATSPLTSSSGSADPATSLGQLTEPQLTDPAILRCVNTLAHAFTPPTPTPA